MKGRRKENSSGGNMLAKKNNREDQKYRNHNQAIGKELGQRETWVDKIRISRLTGFGHVVRMDGKRLKTKALYRYRDGTKSR